MTKRHVVLLLLPSVVFTIVAVLLLANARDMYPDRALTESSVAKLVEKANHGDYGPHGEHLVFLIKSARIGRVDLLETLSRIETLFGCGLLAGIAVQVYLIVRLRSSLNACSLPEKTTAT